MPDYSMPPDERPADMTELARLTAIELRKRFSAVAVAEHVLVGRVRGQNPNFRAELGFHTMTNPDFAGMGPAVIADEIQAIESRKTQEWAGDT